MEAEIKTSKSCCASAMMVGDAPQKASYTDDSYEGIQPVEFGSRHAQLNDAHVLQMIPLYCDIAWKHMHTYFCLLFFSFDLHRLEKDMLHILEGA